MNMIKVNANFISPEYKRNLYRRKHWSCDVPPVPTTNWSDDDWIDRCGAWWVENKSCERAEKT